MLLRKMSLNDARLYLILDRGVNSYEQLFEIAKKAILSGVDIIQLRDKDGSAKEILNFSKRILGIAKGRILYIINDRVDLAVISRSYSACVTRPAAREGRIPARNRASLA